MTPRAKSIEFIDDTVFLGKTREQPVGVATHEYSRMVVSHQTFELHAEFDSENAYRPIAYHFVPWGDMLEHTWSKNCWCCPVNAKMVRDTQIYKHNPFSPDPNEPGPGTPTPD